MQRHWTRKWRTPKGFVDPKIETDIATVTSFGQTARPLEKKCLVSGTKFFRAGAADTDNVTEAGCDAPTCNGLGPDRGGGPRGLSTIVRSHPAVAKAVSEKAAVML